MSPISTIDEYLAGVPADARATLEQLRTRIQAAAPEADEVISYGVPVYKYRGRPLVGFGAAKGHCALYVQSPAVMEAHADALQTYDTAKGTVRFPIGKALPAALVKKLVKARMAETDAAEEKKRAKKR
jgi:uncharacterized protein YdhG (YjbR/CyaY superfamily)